MPDWCVCRANSACPGQRDPADTPVSYIVLSGIGGVSECVQWPHSVIPSSEPGSLDGLLGDQVATGLVGAWREGTSDPL